MKKMKIILIILIIFAIAIVPSYAQKSNKLSKQEKKQGWELIFDGKSFNGWRQFNSETMPANWTIENSAMKVFLGEGIKIGFYYSQSQDWCHPGGAVATWGQWSGPWDKAQAGDYDEYFDKIAVPQVKEILTRYKVGEWMKVNGDAIYGTKASFFTS